MQQIKPHTVKNLDLERYSGFWYELMKIPFKWENNCEGSSAYYWLDLEGQFHLKNTCYIDKNQKYDRTGIANVPDTADSGKLIIQFTDGGPSDGPAPYWVHYTDYIHFALVGSPSGKFLWLLARDTKIHQVEVVNFSKFIKDLGYNLDDIKVMPITEIIN